MKTSPVKSSAKQFKMKRKSDTADGDGRGAAAVGKQKRKCIKKMKVDHTYRDFSKLSLVSVSLHMQQAGERVPYITSTGPALMMPCANGGSIGKKGYTFPQRLYEMVTNPEYRHIICFMPHGRSWTVLDKDSLESEVLPKYFNHSKFESFTRQVNGWGFKRLLGKGPDKKSYYSEFFLRGRPELTTLMIRLVNPGKRIPDRDGEPDFYGISRRNPLPQVGESAYLDHGLSPDVFDPSGNVVLGSNISSWAYPNMGGNAITPPHIHHQALLHPHVPSSKYVPHFAQVQDSLDASMQSMACQEVVGTVPTPAYEGRSSLYCQVTGTVPTPEDQERSSLYCQAVGTVPTPADDGRSGLYCQVVGNHSSPSERYSVTQFDCQGMPNASTPLQVQQTSMTLSAVNAIASSSEFWGEDMPSKPDSMSRSNSFSSDLSLNGSHVEDFDVFDKEMFDISDFIAEPDPLSEPIQVDPSPVAMDDYLTNIKKPGPLLEDFAGIYFSNKTSLSDVFS